MECVVSPALMSAPLAGGGQAPPIIGPAASLAPRSGGWRIRLAYVILAMFLLTPLVCILGVASYFHLSSPTQALRRSVMDSVPGNWKKNFAINAGPLTLDAARFVLAFVKLPPEARAAVESARAAEVGVYRLRRAEGRVNYAAILRGADKAMGQRGWDRIVGVAQDGQFVAVYAPRGMKSLTRVTCCVAVLDHQDFVVVSARGNLEPLLELPQIQDGERKMTRIFGDADAQDARRSGEKNGREL